MALLENYHSSSIIEATTFDDVTGTLTIEFKSGAEYEYYNVNLDTYESLVAASSTGDFFIQHIKNLYGFQKIN